MKRMIRFCSIVVVGLMMVYTGPVHAKGEKKPATVKDVKSLSEGEQVRLALTGAPPHLVKEVGVMIYGGDGKLTEVKKSTNGFTCIPTVMNLPVPDPMCMDAAVQQWMNDLMDGAPKPTNTVPGIAYMARGGSHFEKEGKVVMGGDGAKTVKEPPHWMLMWPFESATTHLPTTPNSSGSYIMFDGTPYAHLMVYQDPRKMK